MVRRVTPSQYNAMVRQAQQRQAQEIRRYNAEVDRVNQHNKRLVDNFNRDVNNHNRKVVSDVNRYNKAVDDENRRRRQQTKQAIDNYNRTVRAHNQQVRADNQRRQQQLNALRSRPVETRYTLVRDATYDLSDRYTDLEARAGSEGLSEELLAASARESSNSIAVMDALLGNGVEDAVNDADAAGVIEYLKGFSDDLCDRWRGAVFALNPNNPDASRHFCTSAREIFTEILEAWAPDADVLAHDPAVQLTPQGKPTRRGKIRYLLAQKGVTTAAAAEFVDADIDNIVQLFGVFNEATHGAAGAHGLSKLKAIRTRVEGGIMFLANIAT